MSATRTEVARLIHQGALGKHGTTLPGLVRLAHNISTPTVQTELDGIIGCLTTRLAHVHHAQDLVVGNHDRRAQIVEINLDDVERSCHTKDSI